MANYLKIKKIKNDEITLILSHFNRDQFIYTIFLTASKQKIGYCDLRTAHSDEMNYYGNIGYRISEKYRGNNYAYKASLLLIEISKMINMDYLLITCSPENIASEKTIQKLRARYIATVEVPKWHPLYINERIKKIYRLDL